MMVIILLCLGASDMQRENKHERLKIVLCNGSLKCPAFDVSFTSIPSD